MSNNNVPRDFTLDAVGTIFIAIGATAMAAAVAANNFIALAVSAVPTAIGLGLLWAKYKSRVNNNGKPQA